MAGTGEEIKAEGKLVIFQRPKTFSTYPGDSSFLPHFPPALALTLSLHGTASNFAVFFLTFGTLLLLFLPFMGPLPFPYTPSQDASKVSLGISLNFPSQHPVLHKFQTFPVLSQWWHTPHLL